LKEGGVTVRRDSRMVEARMLLKEIHAKTIMSKSKVLDYAINPYRGCEHGCLYCYARFMKRFTGHKEEWGKFIDVKVNAPSLLQHEIRRKRVGKVWISGVCDPYQPIENEYEITKRCLEILLRHQWPIVVQTKSNLVLRDIELLRRFKHAEVGLTITTTNDQIRRIFEPEASTISERIEALRNLRDGGVVTFAMLAPILPEIKGLATELAGKVDYVLIDRMNYHYADWVYRQHKLEYALKDAYFTEKKIELIDEFQKNGIPTKILF